MEKFQEQLFEQEEIVKMIYKNDENMKTLNMTHANFSNISVYVLKMFRRSIPFIDR